MLEYEACFFLNVFVYTRFVSMSSLGGYHLSGTTSHLQVHWERWFDWFHLGLLWPQISPGTWGFCSVWLQGYRTLGIQSPKLRMVMDPKYLAKDVIIHPLLIIWRSVIGSLGEPNCLNFFGRRTTEASKQESKAYAEIALSMGIEPSEGRKPFWMLIRK